MSRYRVDFTEKLEHEVVWNVFIGPCFDTPEEAEMEFFQSYVPEELPGNPSIGEAWLVDQQSKQIVRYLDLSRLGQQRVPAGEEVA